MNLRNLVLLLIAILALPLIGSAHEVYAAGLVYVNPPNTSGLAVGSTFAVQVKVVNIDPFNTYDVVVTTDQSVITATSLSVAGNIFSANTTGGIPIEYVHCINGAGQGCITGKSPPIDGPGVVHSAFTNLGFGITASGSGLLFTINYTVVSSKFYSAITIQSAVIAVSGHAVAVTTANGSYGALPDFSVSASPTSLVLLRGSTGVSEVDLDSLGGFSGTLSLSYNSPSGIGLSPAPPSMSVQSGQIVSFDITLSASTTTQASNYPIVITATGPSSSHSTTIIVQVVDFAISASLSTLIVPRGSSNSSGTGMPGLSGGFPGTNSTTIAVSSLNGFAGTVTVSSAIIPTFRHGLTLTPATNAVTIAPGSSAAFILNFTALHRTTPGTYTVTIIATSGTASVTITVTVTVPLNNNDLVQIFVSGSGRSTSLTAT